MFSGRNIATESENENTNPTPQDGDSNFVSNDSTSQEPILDENTTQTTATTSTDDGDDAVGTPLASDSESNIEAPVKLVAAPAAIPAIITNNGKEPTANGNGTLLAASAAGLDSEENSNSNNCLRPVDVDAAESEEYDEDDESSNSNSRRAVLLDNSRAACELPLMNHTNNLADDSSSLSNAATATTTTSPIAAATIVGQKRTLNCADEASLEAATQPEMKKIRSD